MPEHAHQSRSAALWVNDMPDSRSGDHGYRYLAGRTRPIEVSFVAEDGSYYRVKFYPSGRIPTVHAMPREGEL